MTGHRSSSKVAGKRRTARRASIALAMAAVVGLAACRPLQYDLRTGKTASSAEWRVAPIDTGHGPGVDIRLRSCNAVHVTGEKVDLTSELRPRARIVDADGTVVFDNDPYVQVLPAGSRVIEPGPKSDPQRIIVPIGKAKQPLRITASCTDMTLVAGGGFTWTFTPCTAAARLCPGGRAGSGRFVFPRN